MSDFMEELKRLSEAATKDEWRIGTEGMNNDPTLLSGGRVLCYATINDDVAWPNRADLELVAYLGTHRDRIIATLEAADALAEAASTLPPACGECQKLFRLSGGTELTTCAHAIGIRQQNIRDAAAAYKKAKGA